MTERSEIEVPIIVEVEPIGSDGSWDVVDVVDVRDGNSLGDIGVYLFDGDSDFMTDLERAVLESLLENEGFDAGTFYTLMISVRNGGAELGSGVPRFTEVMRRSRRMTGGQRGCGRASPRTFPT